MAVDLEALPIGDEAPRLVNAVIEVPVGSRNKYEFEPKLGLVVRDRVLPGAVRYPTEYGFIPSTDLDGDPVDVLVAAYEPTFPGCVVRVRPLGTVHLHDVEGEDYKVFAVPDDEPRFAGISSLDDLPDAQLREIEQFLETYKRLEGDEDVEIHGWLDLAETHDLILKLRR